ncbi:hypothetical protein [Methylibium sp.]|uniref:hypothetical protein n=1 Tax=Methylibium sp. TaxID=2067992 RepID=UPI0017CCBFA1|nr:hypothetical protein [Methylibium sp.]MBA3588487.1 hypothetical protein [Methylibium sp.]
MTITRYTFDDEGDPWDRGEYVSYSDHTAAMADAYRAGAEAMRDACGHAADAVGAGYHDRQYHYGQNDAYRAVLGCEIPPLPTTTP